MADQHERCSQDQTTDSTDTSIEVKQSRRLPEGPNHSHKMTKEIPRTIRAVLVGCGGMANRWATIALSAEKIELVGLVDLNREQAERLAKTHDLPASLVFDSLDQAVRATEADTVFDVTVPQAHPAVTLKALSLGCHVLVEKPMAESMEHALAMVLAAIRSADERRRVEIAEMLKPDSPSPV